MAANTDVGVLRRTYATPGFHRLLPWPVALATVRVRAARLWRTPAMRELAQESMAYVLGDWCGPDEIEAAAERWVFETLKRDELTWRPWQTTRFPVEGAEVLRDLLDRGQGAIVSFFHHGQYGGFFGSLAREGIRSHCAVLPMFYETPKPGYDGLRDLRHMKTVRRGATTFPAKDCFDHMKELVADGQIVAIASDLPGSLPMNVLGRRVWAASGAARLARDSGVPLVPITSHRRGPLQAIVVGDPIYATSTDDLADIQQRIADAHAPAIAAWPEGLMEPLTRWSLVNPRLGAVAS